MQYQAKQKMNALALRFEILVQQEKRQAATVCLDSLITHLEEVLETLPDPNPPKKTTTKGKAHAKATTTPKPRTPASSKPSKG